MASFHEINLRPIKRETFSNLNVHHWNARSLRNKTHLTCDYIMENDVDIMIITESWLKKDELVIIGESTPPPGYAFLSKPRVSDNYGGGIAVVYKEPLKLSFTEPDIRSPCTFEYTCVSGLTNQKKFVYLLYIDHLPPKKMVSKLLNSSLSSMISLKTFLPFVANTL